LIVQFSDEGVIIPDVLLGGPFVCARYFTFDGTENAQCVWHSHIFVHIYPAALDEQLTVGSLVKWIQREEYAMLPFCATECGLSTYIMPRNTTVLTPANGLVPKVSIIIASQIKNITNSFTVDLT